MDEIYYWKDASIKKTTDIGQLILDLYESKASFIELGTKVNDWVITKEYLQGIKKTLAKYTKRIPLYDILSNSVYLVFKNNLYIRILYDNYRFIDENFYHDISSIANPDDKTQKMIRFLSYYDLPQLKKTYYKVFYESFVINSYITQCPRPSFKAGFSHIQPYYSLNELYYLSYDWELSESKNISLNEITKLCSQIVNYDIPAQILIDHQMYIYNLKAIGLVKHYSLFGSDFMNQYLRKNPFILSH